MLILRPDLFPIGQVKTSPLAISYYTKMALQHPDRSGHRMENLTFKRVRKRSLLSLQHSLIRTDNLADRTFSSLLRTELFDTSIPHTSHDSSRAQTPPATSSLFPGPAMTPSTPHKNLFTFSTPHRNSLSTPNRTPSSRRTNMNPHSEMYSLSPVKFSSQKMLLSPRKTPRTVSKVPYKVLDAPDLADDF